jgi:hypothetical protein
MPQPGQFAPRGEDEWVRRVQDLEARLQRIEAANVFGLTGITPKDGGTDLDGFVNINGPLTVDGDSEINGSMSINGPLNLQPGSIQNDSLADPTYPYAFHADAQNFALGNGDNLPVVSITVPVPAGFTRAVVNATASLSAANSTSATDTLYCGLKVNGSGPGFSGRVGVAPGVAANPSKTAGVILTSLGSSFVIEGTASTYAAPWPADMKNNANLDGTVIFLR